jgi:hypothetical protein
LGEFNNYSAIFSHETSRKTPCCRPETLNVPKEASLHNARIKKGEAIAKQKSASGL